MILTAALGVLVSIIGLGSIVALILPPLCFVLHHPFIITVADRGMGCDRVYELGDPPLYCMDVSREQFFRNTSVMRFCSTLSVKGFYCDIDI